MKLIERHIRIRKDGLWEWVRVVKKKRKRYKKPTHKGRGLRHRYGKPRRRG